MKDQLTGIILAGGKSSRMGKDKGLISLNGRSLIEYAMDILKPVADEIMISTNNAAYGKFDATTVNDIFEDIGPMGGIYSCLSKSMTDMNIVLSCDMPFVRPELFQYLMDHAEDQDVILPSRDGIYPEPMCGIYRKSVLHEMDKFIHQGNYKLPDLFKAIRFQQLLIHESQDFFSKDLFTNINTEEELKMAEQILLKTNL